MKNKQYTLQEKSRRRSKNRAYWKENLGHYMMLVPGMLCLAVFTFIPMYGLYMAFVDYNPMNSNLFDNKFLGLYWFELMFTEPNLWNLVKNTLILNLLKLLICFPAPILLALLINEINNRIFKRTFQTISYLPNFISWVIVSGMLTIFLNTDNGILNAILEFFGMEPVSWYSDPSKWRAILVITSLWKGVGWGTIMFLSAITAIDPVLYEAATMDGASKFRQVFAVTLPGIAPTITITLILTIGKLFSDDFDQIYSLVGGNTILGETTEVISTQIFGFVNSGAYKEFPLATAYGLVQGIISLILIVSSNAVTKKMGQEGIW